MFSRYLNRQKRTGRTSSTVASQSKYQSQDEQMLQNLPKGTSNKQKPIKDKICWHFRRGNCKSGEQCKWSHILDKVIAPSQPVSRKGRTGNSSTPKKATNPKNKDICWNYVRGNCKHGKNCKWKHEEKTSAGSSESCRPNHNSNQRHVSRGDMHMWNNTQRRFSNLHIGLGARHRRSYALPPPQPKKPKGPWTSEVDLPVSKKSGKASKTPSTGGKNPISILCELGQHKKMSLDWKIIATKKGFTCTVFLDGRFLASASGPTKKSLKFNVAAKGVAVLERHSRFLELITRLKIGKHAFLVRNEAKAMKKEGLLLLGDPSLSDALKPHNIGYKILLKMGWDPTKGLGKSLQGLTEPVSLELKNNVRLGKNKRGLGYADPKEAETTFTDGAERKIREFANSTLTQMQFSKDLTKEERALIHELAKKYHVKSKSVGKDKERSLFLFKYKI